MKITGSAIDLLCDSNMEYMFLMSLISSDNIRTVKDAETSLKFIDEVEEALKHASIPIDKKKEFEKYIAKGRDILHADIERFKEEN